MGDLRLAICGAGFWAQFQIAAWRELPGVEIAAIYNRTRDKAEALAAGNPLAGGGIPAVYDDAEAMLREVRPDALDIITDVDHHEHFVRLAVAHGIPAICQKPLAPTLAVAEAMVRHCVGAGVPLIVHENWRWQTPLRALKADLDSGVVGAPFRARIQFSSSFPVFDNQPFLRDLEQFILTDIGSHILDVATVMLRRGGVTTTCEMSYASRLEGECFPETFVLIEAERGSLELAADYWVRRTTAEGTFARRVPPPRFGWADPAYDLVQSSIVPCNADILHALQGGPPAETRGEDNIETVRPVFGAYESAATGRVVTLKA